MPVPVVVLCRTVAIVAAIGIGIFFAIKQRKQQRLTYHTNGNDDETTRRTAQTHGSAQTGPRRRNIRRINNDEDDRSTPSSGRQDRPRRCKSNATPDTGDGPMLNTSSFDGTNDAAPDTGNDRFAPNTSSYGQNGNNGAAPRSRRSSGKSDKDECLICCESLDDTNVITLKCKHNFHLSCILQWFKEQETCPLCRKDYVNLFKSN